MSVGDWWYSPNNIFEISEFEIANRLKKSDVILIPVGSCEQHGPAIPINCDSLGAWITVKLAAEITKTLHTPLVWCGYSPQHMRPPGKGAGTITLRSNTFKNLLYDIGRSVIHHGFNKLIFITGHTSNIKIIDPVLRMIRYETGAFTSLFRADAEVLPKIKDIRANILKAPPEDNPGWHAGEAETALCMWYNIKSVDLKKAKWDRKEVHAPKYLPQSKFTKNNGTPYVTFNGQDEMIYVPMDHHEYSNSGIVGNPKLASADTAEKIYNNMANKLADYIKEIENITTTITKREFINRT